MSHQPQDLRRGKESLKASHCYTLSGAGKLLFFLSKNLLLLLWVPGCGARWDTAGNLHRVWMQQAELAAYARAAQDSFECVCGCRATSSGRAPRHSSETKSSLGPSSRARWVPLGKGLAAFCLMPTGSRLVFLWGSSSAFSLGQKGNWGGCALCVTGKASSCT